MRACVHSRIRRWVRPASALLLFACGAASAAETSLATIRQLSQEQFDQVVTWRRDFHRNPELSNREFRTAGIVAEHLESLGMDVSTGIAHTGVVGVLRGGKPGPVVMLRADMDGLPVPERNDLPFRSTATGEYNGETVPVMHACGHDAHVAILMGAAEVLAALRDDLPGTVKFVFQPAEEGAPVGERGGAELMIEEGVLDNPRVDAAFALHVSALDDAGRLGYSFGPRYASVDDFSITVRGRQAHGASPWLGVDPIVVSAQIVSALQTIVSRNLQITDQPAIVTVGSIHGGLRSNIIPEEVKMVGTIRALSEPMRRQIHRRIREIAEGTAETMGASAEVQIPMSTSYPVTVNDGDLARMMVPVLRTVAGPGMVANEVPGFYISLGGKKPGKPLSEVAAHHTPDFHIEETGLATGVAAMAAMAWTYLTEQGATRSD